MKDEYIVNFDTRNILPYFQQFHKKWVQNYKSSISSKHLEKLISPNIFDSELSQLLGPDVTANVAGLTRWDKILMFYWTLVEHYSAQSYLNNHCAPIKQIIDGIRALRVSYSKENGVRRSLDCYLPKDLVEAEAKRPTNSQPGEGTFTELIRFLFNIPPLDALATLSNMEGTDITNLYIPTKKMCYPGPITRDLDNTIPTAMRCGDWQSSVPSFELRNKAFVRGNNGQPISLFLEYSGWTSNFFIAAPIISSSCALGRAPAYPHFYNEHLLATNNRAPVILFQDMRVAHALQMRWENEYNYNPRSFVITSILGYEPALYQLNYLRSREVVFVPSPTAPSLAMARVYRQIAKDHEAYFGVATKFWVEQIGVLIGPAKVEPSMIATEIYLTINELQDSRMTTQKILEDIYHTAIDYEVFREKYVKLGVFEPSKSDKNKKGVLSPVSVELDPRLVLQPALDIKDLTANHLLYPGGLVMVSGLKNSGKTQASYLLAKCALQDEHAIKPFCDMSPASLGNVCIVDAESNKVEIEANLKQHDLKKFEGNKLHIILPYAENKYGFDCDFDMTAEKGRQQLEEVLNTLKCRVLCLDNLTALMGDKINYPAPSYEVVKWLKKLAASGMCIIYLMHKAPRSSNVGRDRNSGSKIFKDLSRVIINIFGKEEIAESESLGIAAPRDVTAMIKNGGLTMGMEFATCKNAPVFHNHTIWCHLPLNGHWEPICWCDAQGNIIDKNTSIYQPSPALTTSATKEDFPTSVQPSNLARLPMKAKLIYDTLAKLEGLVSISELMAKLPPQKGLKRDAIRSHLMRLHELGLVTQSGQGKGRKYAAVLDAKKV